MTTSFNPRTIVPEDQAQFIDPGEAPIVSNFELFTAKKRSLLNNRLLRNPDLTWGHQDFSVLLTHDVNHITFDMRDYPNGGGTLFLAEKPNKESIYDGATQLGVSYTQRYNPASESGNTLRGDGTRQSAIEKGPWAAHEDDRVYKEDFVPTMPVDDSNDYYPIASRDKERNFYTGAAERERLGSYNLQNKEVGALQIEQHRTTDAMREAQLLKVYRKYVRSDPRKSEMNEDTRTTKIENEVTKYSEQRPVNINKKIMGEMNPVDQSRPKVVDGKTDTITRNLQSNKTHVKMSTMPSLTQQHVHDDTSKKPVLNKNTDVVKQKHTTMVQRTESINPYETATSNHARATNKDVHGKVSTIDQTRGEARDNDLYRKKQQEVMDTTSRLESIAKQYNVGPDKNVTSDLRQLQYTSSNKSGSHVQASWNGVSDTHHNKEKASVMDARNGRSQVVDQSRGVTDGKVDGRATTGTKSYIQPSGRSQTVSRTTHDHIGQQTTQEAMHKKTRDIKDHVGNHEHKTHLHAKPTYTKSYTSQLKDALTSQFNQRKSCKDEVDDTSSVAGSVGYLYT